MSKQNSVGSWIVAVIVVLGVVAAGIYLARKAMHPTSAPTATTPTLEPSSSVPDAAGSTIMHPISQASTPADASSAPLPALDDSEIRDVVAFLNTLTDGYQPRKD